VVLIRSQVSQQKDVAAVLGVSPQRVAQMLQKVGGQLQELAERRLEPERPVASPRAARLRELQDNPPEWLVNTISRVPARHKSSSGVTLAGVGPIHLRREPIPDRRQRLTPFVAASSVLPKPEQLTL
jgi:DNA-binding transcriptional regulator YdaS (Cro superfamily)